MDVFFLQGFYMLQVLSNFRSIQIFFTRCLVSLKDSCYIIIFL
jgi:hypothetical protein